MGRAAIFGGSYGWASAGRFHDAQHQIHRFLNLAGGYVRSVNSYSSGAATVILPHVIGPQGAVAGNNVSWAELVAESALVLAFGGMALKNNDVGGGGTSQHIAREPVCALRASAGVEFHLIGPLRDDLPAEIEAVWHSIRPGTDVALMLGMAHTLVTEGRHDRAFLDRFCVGWEEFEAYLLGRSDGQPKDAAWAAAICGIPADEIIALARRAVGRRTLITCSQSLQRAEHGEQPVWMGVVLAAMLGQIGLPGGGFAYALGSTSNTGKPPLAVPLPDAAARPQQHRRFHPGGAHRRHAAAPRRAVRLQRPAADLSRHQAGLLGRRQSVPPPPGSEPAAPRLRPPGHCHRARFGVDRDRAPRRYRVAGDDHPGARGYRRLGRRSAVGGDAPRRGALRRGARRLRDLRRSGRSGSASPKHSPRAARHASGSRTSTSRPVARCCRAASTRPISTSSGKRASWCCRLCRGTAASLRDFRRNPDAAPLPTPSGKIEISSATIAGFGYPDCPGHPAWLPPVEGAGSPAAARFPLQLDRQPAGDAAAQPARFRRHQPGVEVNGREPVRIHPHDAAARGIGDGDIVRLFNDRGACLAGAVLSDALRPGVVQLSTGAWYDPDDPAAGQAALRARQPERADPRRRHLAPRARLHRPALPGRDRALRRPPAADQGFDPPSGS